MPAALPSDMEVAKLRFWCPWLPLKCCLPAPAQCTPARAIPRGSPLFPNSHEKHPPCGASKGKNMSLGAVNSTEEWFLMILLGPVLLLLQPRELPGQKSAESPSHHPGHALPMLLASHWPGGAPGEPGWPRCCEKQPFALGRQREGECACSARAG